MRINYMGNYKEILWIEKNKKIAINLLSYFIVAVEFLIWKKLLR